MRVSCERTSRAWVGFGAWEVISGVIARLHASLTQADLVSFFTGSPCEGIAQVSEPNGLERGDPETAISPASETETRLPSDPKVIFLGGLFTLALLAAAYVTSEIV